MTKKKWWIILLAVLLAAAIGIFAFWDVLAIYIAPKTVLTAAVSDTVSQLEQRFAQSPLAVIAKSLDPDGRYTAQMELETENDLVGNITYDMSVRMDTSSNQLLAEGIASTSGNDLDISIYMDKNFMALSSEDLVKGAYYGITYETFSDDIRSIPLLSLLVNESILSEWDAAVDSIQEQMSRSYQLPDFSEVSEVDMRQLLTAILLLPSDVEPVEMPVWGVYVKGHRITYSAEGEQVREVLSYLMDTGDGSDAFVSATFYLYENQIVMMQLQGKAGGNSIRCALELMFDTPDTLMLRMASDENGEENGFSIRHEAQMSGGYLYETWTHYPSFEARGEATGLSYRWEPSTGELVISQEDSSDPISMYLTETENGFRLETDAFGRLFGLFSQQDKPSPPMSCVMTVSRGAMITTPEYKNLNTWSLDDLLILLGGAGSLFGLKIA